MRILMETKTFLKFDVTSESEKRFTVKSEVFKRAITSGILKIYKILNIEQRWIMDGDKYTGRIRQTINSTSKNKEKSPKYEHTVKHHISKSMDYEITTDLAAEDYALLGKLYKDKPLQSKLRIYVTDVSGDYDKYIITADILDDNPEICWIEFETNDGDIKKEKFKKPSWVEEIKE